MKPRKPEPGYIGTAEFVVNWGMSLRAEHGVSVVNLTAGEQHTILPAIGSFVRELCRICVPERSMQISADRLDVRCNPERHRIYYDQFGAES